jgi:type IX secretion system PorP/SprF family membrane protein
LNITIHFLKNILASHKRIYFSVFSWALLTIALVQSHSVQAQDPQFSQFYSAPLYLNPGFAGSTQQGRAGLNYRNQWPSVDNANFVTMSAYADYFLEDFNSGIGLLVTADRQGPGGLRSNSVSLQYAYQVNLTKNLTFRPGVEVGYVFRDIDYSSFVFGDQYDPTNPDPNQGLPSSGEGVGNETLGYVDLAMGGILYSQNFWVGVAAHHLTTPNQSFYDDGISDLPRKFSAHAGYRFNLKPVSTKRGYNLTLRERSITPSVLYKMQGDFDQLDAGLYYTHEPLVVGVWYRGLPFKPLEGINNHESMIFLLGFTKNNLNIGYSFDYTISKLGIDSGGAHEVSISYEFSLADPRKPPRNVRRIPCPKF